MVTAAVDAWAGDHSARSSFLSFCLRRFARQDWGNTHPEDKKLNDRAFKAKDGDRMLAAYAVPESMKEPGLCDDKLWICVAGWGDHKLGDGYCYTTIMWPSDY